MIENETEPTKEELIKILDEKLESLQILKEIGKDTNYFQELSDIALIQLQLGNFVESEKNFIICLNHFKKQKDRLGQASVYGILATLYFKKDNYQKAIEFYEKAYDIYKNLNQIEEQIMCLKGIGNTYIKLNQFDEACNILLDCSTFCSQNNDVYNLLDCLGNLIYINEKNQKWDVLFELYKKTLKAFKEIKDYKGIITSYFNLGILRKKNDDFEESLRYFKKGTNVAIDANYVEQIIKGLGYIGEIFFYLGKLKEAKNQFIKALHIAKQFNARNAIIQIRILLQSLGLQDRDITEELKKIEKNRELSNIKK
ncbi:MAG: tetratricopeptide repeat protein [Candidatus Odinarchaeota archaeon]